MNSRGESSQQTIRSRWSTLSALPTASTFAARLAAVITTPRGVPVLPDVYWMSAGSSPVAGRASGASRWARERGSITGRPWLSRPDWRRCAAVRRSAKTAEGAASRTTLASRFTNAVGLANPSSEGRGTGTAPISDAPRNPSRNARPVGTQSSTRSPRRRPLATSAAAQLPAPRLHSPSVTGSSRNLPRAVLPSRWTAARSGSRVAQASSRAVIESGIRDEPFHQARPEAAPETACGKPAALELIRQQRPVAVQDAQPLHPLQRVPAHLSRREAELVPDRLGEMCGDARADALEHEVLHLRSDRAGEHLRERLAQLLAVGEMAGLVPQIHAQDGCEQRLARPGHQGGEQRGRVPLEYLLRDQREQLAMCGPLFGREHQHLRDQGLAAVFADQEIREMEAGLAKDERVPLCSAHVAKLPQARCEEALPGKDVAARIDLEVPRQLLELPGVAQGRFHQSADTIHVGTACSDTATVVPLPGSLSTRTVPCWAATSSCTIERPRPVPEPGGLVVKKGSKIRERFSLLMPQPLSATESSTRSPLLRAAMRTSPVCGSTACNALWTMFRITWNRSCGLARTISPSMSWTMRTPLGVCGAIILSASGTTSESLTAADALPLSLRPKSSSWRVTAVILSRLVSMSAIIASAAGTAAMCLRSSAMFPPRKWMGLFISCATPATMRPSATIFSFCTSDVSALFSCSSASRIFLAWARRRRWSSIRACSSWRSNGLWT